MGRTVVLEEQIKELEYQIEYLKDYLAEVDQRVAATGELIESLLEENENHEERIAALEAQIENHEEELSVDDARISELEDFV